MITVYIGNIHLTLKFDNLNDREIEWILQQIHLQLDPLDPDRYRKKQFNLRDKSGARIWDGRVKICDFSDIHKPIIPTGLYDELRAVLDALHDSNGIDYKEVDKRSHALSVAIPGKITIDGHGKEKTITLRDYQYQSVVNAFREQSGILLEATNAGKCLQKSTILYTNYGELTIEDVFKLSGVNVNDNRPRLIKPLSGIKVVNGYGKLEEPAGLTINGIKDTLKISTELGNSITLTPNNPVLTVTDGFYKWKRADKLQKDDLLVLRLGSNSYGNDSTFSSEDAYCLGLLVADGCYHNQDFNFTNNEPVLIDIVAKWFNRLTGINPRLEKRIVNGKYSATSVNLKSGGLSHNTIKKRLELGNVLSNNKEIPYSIMKSPKDIQVSFLSGFFECEMSFDSYNGKDSIELTNKSYKLMTEIQQLLINMGIYTKSSIKLVEGYNEPYYRFWFDTTNSVKLVSLLKFKTNNRQDQVNRLKQGIKSRKRNLKGYAIPNGKKLMYSYYKTLPLTIRQSIRHKGQIPHTISKQRVNKILDMAPNGDNNLYNHLRSLASPDTMFVRVTNIENGGKIPTYDLEMPNTHSLLANGMVVHNTSIAISIYKYLINKINDNEHLLFIAPNAGIMNQLYKKYCHYLGDNITGIWGDGKKDLAKPIIVATIQTLASAIKKPKVKMTRKKDRLLERLATKYGPAVIEHGSPRANLRLLAMNYRPKYKYEEDDPDLLKELYSSVDNDQQTVELFKGYQKSYKRRLHKLDEKGFKKYEEAVNLLHSVVAVICDEAHYAGAISYWNVFQYLDHARMRIGMTGTLDKSKTVKMTRIKALMGKPIMNVTNSQMISRGVSAKPHIKMVPINQPTDLDAQVGAYMKKNGMQVGGSVGDLMAYQVTYNLGVIHNQYRNRLIAQIAVQSAKRLKKKAVLIIVNSIEHGELISQELDKLNADYDFIQGKDDTDTRNKVLNRVKSGDLKIIIGTKILDAGIDIPNIQIFIECSGGKSYITLLQRIGRTLRIMNDKKDIYIFDLWDCTTSGPLYKHGKQRLKYYKEQGFDVQ